MPSAATPPTQINTPDISGYEAGISADLLGACGCAIASAVERLTGTKVHIAFVELEERFRTPDRKVGFFAVTLPKGGQQSTS